jgi:hypothetical protein
MVAELFYIHAQSAQGSSFSTSSLDKEDIFKDHHSYITKIAILSHFILLSYAKNL